jgi:SRSO17 transposase
MRAALDGPEADFIFDDTSFIKQGQHSVGVQHQYCGSLGKRANCQVAVSLHYATTKGHYPLAMRLYLPDTWTSAPKRLEKARVPLEHRVPKTKHQIAIALLDEAIAESHQARTVLADAGYGSSSAFRKQLDERGLTYAVGVRAETVAFTKKPIWKRAGDKGVPPNRRHPRLADESPRPKSLEEIAATLKFRECKWREGTKGWLVAPFARTRVWPAQDWQNGTCADEKPVWLIVEKRGDELRYHFSNAPDGITMNHLVRLLKNRWPVEQGYQQLKEELGLDHFEGRSWPGFHHHVCMTLLAFGFLELERQRLKRDIKPGSQKNSTTAANAALCAACLAADSSTSATSSLLALQSED